jgi:hypothetical protein
MKRVIAVGRITKENRRPVEPVKKDYAEDIMLFANLVHIKKCADSAHLK